MVSSVLKHSVCYIIKRASVYFSNLHYLCFYISKINTPEDIFSGVYVLVNLLPISFCSFNHSNQSLHIIVASPYVAFINSTPWRLWVYCMQKQSVWIRSVFGTIVCIERIHHFINYALVYFSEWFVINVRYHLKQSANCNGSGGYYLFPYLTIYHINMQKFSRYFH